MDASPPPLNIGDSSYSAAEPKARRATRMVSLSSVTRQYNFSLTIGFPVGICMLK
jgi:hypothetical protein